MELLEFSRRFYIYDMGDCMKGEDVFGESWTMWEIGALVYMIGKVSCSGNVLERRNAF